MNLCINCKHYWATYCTRETRISPVDGQPNHPNIYASVARSWGPVGTAILGACGQAGKHFEPKEPA